MNPILSVREELIKLTTNALQKARTEGALIFETMPDFVVEVPKDAGHGDFSTNAAMLLAKQARMAPKKIAEIMLENMEMHSMSRLEHVEIAGAGFINYFLDRSWLYEIPVIVSQLGEHYGEGPSNGIKVQVEFVSANPTGNLHMGNARGGALGDSLASVLQKAGYTVQREFYINDAGNQIEIFSQSLEARYLQLMGQQVDFPENGYAGQDVVDTVKQIISQYQDSLLAVSQEERRAKMVDYALKEKVAYIKTTLANFGIHYDRWFSEKDLHEQGKIDEVIQYLKGKDYIYEKEGALWFRSTLFGDEKDEVVVRANGIPTYFAADIAYHKDKFERGFDWVINVWGADHHGHVARMKGAMEALGYDPKRLDVILMQLVRLYRGGQVVRMSKRTGTTVSLDELVDEVGKDAARFSFAMRSPDSQMEFDLELAKKKSMDNPVYYVQYANARIMSIFRQGKTAGVEFRAPSQVDFSVLGDEELEILRKVADFPEEIAMAAKNLAPHRIARYVQDLAGMFHSFYNHHRVLNVEQNLQDARLCLLECCRICIKNSLDILGVSAPDQM